MAYLNKMSFLNKNDINAEDRFKLINEAYEYLRDPNKRNQYF